MAPASSATLSVPSSPPSTTTRVVTASPHSADRHAGQHGADVVRFVVGTDEGDDGGEDEARIAGVEETARRADRDRYRHRDAAELETVRAGKDLAHHGLKVLERLRRVARVKGVLIPFVGEGLGQVKPGFAPILLASVGVLARDTRSSACLGSPDGPRSS